MYKAIVRSQVRKGYAKVSSGDFDDLLGGFADDAVFQMMGEHSLGGERHGRDEIRAWFEEVGRLWPDLKLEPVEIVVSGGPWNTHVATRFRVSSEQTGYENEGMQFMRLRWAKVVEDRLFEDTKVLEAALDASRPPATQPNRAATAAATSSAASSTK